MFKTPLGLVILISIFFITILVSYIFSSNHDYFAFTMNALRLAGATIIFFIYVPPTIEMIRENVVSRIGMLSTGISLAALSQMVASIYTFWFFFHNNRVFVGNEIISLISSLAFLAALFHIFAPDAKPGYPFNVNRKTGLFVGIFVFVFVIFLLFSNYTF